MTRCRELEEQLSLYVDDLLDATDAADVRAHLDTCPACAGLASDLSRIAGTARLLGPITPPPHVYERIAAALPGVASSTGRRPTSSWPIRRWAAVAAALVAVASLAWLAGLHVGVRAPTPAADSPIPVTGLAAVAAELDLAVRHYERAIAELEAVTSGAGLDLDPELARSVRASLGALDRAIAESRGALASDPASEPARTSLFEALRLKVDVLQSTVVIRNESGGYQPAEAERPVISSTESEL